MENKLSQPPDSVRASFPQTTTTSGQPQNADTLATPGAMKSVSAIRRLPPEVLLETFDLCIYTADSFAVPSPAESQVVLSHVCKSWRSIILGTAYFWSKVDLGDSLYDPPEPQTDHEFDTRTCISLKRQTKVVPEWLSRARGQPLFLRLMFNPTDAEERQTEACSLVQATIPFAMSWLSVSIDAAPVVISWFSPSLINDAPILEHLSIRGIMTPTETIMHVDVPFPMTSPIEHIDLFFASFSQVSNILRVADTLRILKAYQVPNSTEASFSLDDVYTVLKICQTLEVVDVTITQIKDAHLYRKNNHDRISLPSLYELTLRNYAPVPAGPLLDHLHAENLEKLEIMDILVDWKQSPYTHVSAFLRRVRPPLDTFAIHGTPMTADEIEECLKLTPWVRTLSFDRSNASDDILSRLMWSFKEVKRERSELRLNDWGDVIQSDNENLLPYLDRLCIEPGGSPISVACLVSLVQSRCIEEIVDDHPARFGPANPEVIDFADMPTGDNNAGGFAVDATHPGVGQVSHCNKSPPRPMTGDKGEDTIFTPYGPENSLRTISIFSQLERPESFMEFFKGFLENPTITHYIQSGFLYIAPGNMYPGT